MITNPLVRKEIRLLIPSFLIALPLALVPVWFDPHDPYSHPYGQPAAIYLFLLGPLMLALSSFGQEFSLGTFPLALAQPFERARLWRTKVVVLGTTTTTVFIAWCLSYSSCVFATNEGQTWLETLAMGGVTTAALFSGGLWSTLLLRNIAGAFWFTALIPAAIAILVGFYGGPVWLILAALGVYSVAGFLFARWQFLRIQEAGWTGGDISIGDWKTQSAPSRALVRIHRPLAALVRKELQLHQLSLTGMALLFVLHVAVAMLRKVVPHSNTSPIFSALQVFGGIWFAVPLLVGASSVAEERKIGVMEILLCLSVSRRIQFTIKLFFALALGGILSAALFWTAEGIATLVGAGTDAPGIKEPFDLAVLAILFLVCLGLTLIGFHASTLTRSLVQGLAVGVAATSAIFTIWASFSTSLTVFDQVLWQGMLLNFFTLPTFTAAFLWLGWHNFRSGAEITGLWRRNLIVIASALVFTAVSTTAIYNRTWELVTPLEPQHGPAALPGPASAKRVKMSGFNDGLVVQLPDGRLVVARVNWYQHSSVAHLLFQEKWSFNTGNRIIPGSNWLDAAHALFHTFAIRSDGTLWELEWPLTPWEMGWRSTQNKPAADPVRIGYETNWKSVVPESSSSMVLLKHDGTLWRLGTNSNYVPKTFEWRSAETRPLLTESSWSMILQGADRIYAWKDDGTAWCLHPPGGNRFPTNNAEVPLLIEPQPPLDNTRWKSLAEYGRLEVGVREDGTLWAWPAYQSHWTVVPVYSVKPLQIGSDTNWVSVAGESRQLAALRADGTIWSWHCESWLEAGLAASGKLGPVQLGSNRDWVAVSQGSDGILSLAADGSLWNWSNPSNPTFLTRNRNWNDLLLRASRRPARVGSIFALQR